MSDFKAGDIVRCIHTGFSFEYPTVLGALYLVRSLCPNRRDICYLTGVEGAYRKERFEHVKNPTKLERAIYGLSDA